MKGTIANDDRNANLKTIASTLTLIAYSLLAKFFPAVNTTWLPQAIGIACIALFWAMLHFGLYNTKLLPKENKILEQEQKKLEAMLR